MHADVNVQGGSSVRMKSRKTKLPSSRVRETGYADGRILQTQYFNFCGNDSILFPLNLCRHVPDSIVVL